MKTSALLIALTFVTITSHSQSLSEALAPLYSGDAARVNDTWQKLQSEEKIPLAYGDSVALLYRGSAKAVEWMGDFNGWGYDKGFRNKGSLINGTDIWILKTSFPRDARLDYKIVVNGQWILDPENPHQQWSGVGGGSPNSELRMPEWKRDSSLEGGSTALSGHLRKDLLIHSTALGYQVTYSVYTPHGYDPDKSTYPILYVTDGYEYLHEEMGGMRKTLDHLISDKKILPLVVVFVDHREPAYRNNNRRMQELAMNENYLKFFVDELIPKVEQDLKVRATNKERGIMGASMGGLTAAYFSFSRPDVFGIAGIQSPAFWLKPEIYTVCDNPDSPPVKVFLTTGLIHDAKEASEKMKTILEKNTCTFQYQEVNQGHSWGQWKDLVDDMLVYFFAAN